MIYLDNAATTMIKPDSVYESVINSMKTSANAGRGGYGAALKSSEMIFEAREAAAKLFSIADPERIVFTPNATYALNTAIKGISTYGGHMVISSMEHNSVLRPMQALADKKIITYSVAKADRYGLVTADSIINEIRKNTRLIVVTHISNVCGTINDIYDIRQKTGDIPLLIDAAQSAGIANIDMTRLKNTMLAFPGHKGLYGPQGTGGLYIPQGIELNTLTEGGTGSESESTRQPAFLPDRFESGTMNAPGIAGLKSGIEFVLQKTPKKLLEHELTLAGRLITELKKIPKLRITGYDDTNSRSGVVSFYVKDTDCVEICNALESKFSIASRGGLHCAPLAHSTLGTLFCGAVRLSIGAFNTENDIDTALFAIKKLLKP